MRDGLTCDSHVSCLPDRLKLLGLSASVPAFLVAGNLGKSLPIVHANAMVKKSHVKYVVLWIFCLSVLPVDPLKKTRPLLGTGAAVMN
jgi:hypothetical protein